MKCCKSQAAGAQAPGPTFSPTQAVGGAGVEGLELELWEVRQHLDTREIADVAGATRAALEGLATSHPWPRGGEVAITAGSRGIDRIVDVLRAAAEYARARGCRPFILGAMGSHGGSTAAGQMEVLRGYGITEESVGCPVRTCVESVEIGRTPEGLPVLCNRLALVADGVLLVNRVKPHTILTGELGSGLMKMAAIGLGGPRGADTIHARGLPECIVPATRVLLERLPILGGIGIVENAADRVCVLEAVPPSAIEATDRRLLALARSILPSIPFDPIHVLVTRWMGKNLSGTGMDPNVIGMHRRLGGPPERRIDRIVALDLTPESHGNAIGVGMADVITMRLRNQIDWQATYANGLTSGFFAGIKLPVALPTDREAIATALKGFPPETVRLVIIRDTAHLERMLVSPALLEEARAHPRLSIAETPTPLRFGEAGELLSVP